MSSTHRNADEAKAEHMRLMGDELGVVYSALWQEVAWVHGNWSDFVTLFGTKESRVNLLNAAAPALQTHPRLNLGKRSSPHRSTNRPSGYREEAEPHDTAPATLD